MGEITLELHLVFQIPESGLTINGLIGGLKQAVGQIHGAILESLMQAFEERLIETMMDNDPVRYQRNGSQSKPRHLQISMSGIAYLLFLSQLWSRHLKGQGVRHLHLNNPLSLLRNVGILILLDQS